MTQFSLYKTYIKLALRHSWKNKWSVIINVIGLGLSLSMCIFVYTLYAYNFEFDDFYEDTEDIYRLNSITLENEKERRNELSPYALENVLEEQIASIKQSSGVFDGFFSVKKDNEYFEESFNIVSGDFIEMFNIPLRYGSYVDFDSKPLVYLTNTTARKYFGDRAALGETLTIYINSSRKIEVTVAGVFERIPLNSSFDFDMLISDKTYFKGAEYNLSAWDNRFYKTQFLRIDEKSIPHIIEQISTYLPKQNEGHPEFKMNRFELIPFQSPLHQDEIMYRKNTNARLSPPVFIIFTILALMIFLISCFNLANSSIALISTRLKEIGVRKTLGSENQQILVQFLIEMGMVCLLSLIIGLSIINYTSDTIMGLFGQSFLIKDVNLTRVIIFLFLFLSLTTLTAGLMPALYAWKFQPSSILRKSVKLKGIGWISKALITAQFSFSIAVLSSSITFSQNQEFLDNLDVGYADDNIYSLYIHDEEQFLSIKKRVDQIPGVSSVGSFNHIQYSGRTSNRRLLEIDTNSFELRTYTIGSGYLDLMKIPIISGRTFINGSVKDSVNSIIVNQTFAKKYFKGLDPINKKVKIDGYDKVIVGVFKDLIQDVRTNASFRPTALLFSNSVSFPYLTASVSHGQKKEIEDQIKVIWYEEVDRPYEGSWQKDLRYGSAVRETTNLKLIFSTMAIIGCILSIAGIFSQAQLNVSKRLKEISIRKVLGSTLRELYLVINKPFYRILIISLVVGGSLGHLIADQVLGMVYKYYVSVNPMIGFLCGVFMSVITIGIITYSISSLARSNPVSGLREEY